MSTATILRADETQTDRRRHVRVAARGVASHLQTMDASMPGLAVENLSAGGMFVRCAATLAVGTRVMVQLVRPGLKKAIPALGCVVSVVAPAEAQKKGTVAGMGLRLDPAERDAAQRLRDLVDDLAQAPVHPSSPPPPPPVLVAVSVPVAAVHVVRSVEPAMPAAVDTSSEDTETRSLLIQQLEDEVVALRRELLRRNRTIGDMAARIAALEAAQTATPPRDPRRDVRRSAVRPRAPRAVDPRAE